MRDRLDRMVQQDQAVAAAAAAREKELQLPTGGRRTSSTNGGKQQLPGLPPQSPSSRFPSQQQQQQQQSHHGVPLPARAVTVPKLDVHLPTGGQVPSHHVTTDGSVGQAQAAQRPPLQRFTTAPPASLAARVHQQQQPQGQTSEGLLPPVQPPRSRADSGQSPPGSPKAAAPFPASTSAPTSGSYVGPGGQLPSSGSAGGSVVSQSGGSQSSSGMLPAPRGRGTWRMSGDGTADLVLVPHPLLGMRSGQGALHATITVSGASGNGSGLKSPTRPSFDGSGLRVGQGAGLGLGRVGWNGGAGARNGSGSGNGGGGSSSGAVGRGEPASLLDGHTGGRKAHSMAGNELLPVPLPQPHGGRSLHPLNAGITGRAIAPQAGPGTAGSSANSSSGGGAANAVPAGHTATTAAVPSRRSPSPQQPAMGVRGISATTLGPLAQGGARGSGDGRDSSTGCVSTTGYAGYSVGYRGRVSDPQNVPIPQGASMNGLDAEPSDGWDGPAYNDGRRASDTVLYAPNGVKEAKMRGEKGSHVANGSSGVPNGPMRAQTGLLDNVSVGYGGGVSGIPHAPGVSANGGSGGTHGNVLRAPSFKQAAQPNGPPSPEPSATSLPPLNGTTPRRVSASDSATTGVVLSGIPFRDTSRSASGVPMMPTAGLGREQQGAGGYMQRHANGKQSVSGAAQAGQLQQQYLVSEMSENGSDYSIGSGTHNFLPALEAVGAKGTRNGAQMGGGSGPGAVLAGRRPGKTGVRSTPSDTGGHCKREEGPKVLALEAVPEAGVL